MSGKERIIRGAGGRGKERNAADPVLLYRGADALRLEVRPDGLGFDQDVRGVNPLHDANAFASLTIRLSACVSAD